MTKHSIQDQIDHLQRVKTGFITARLALIDSIDVLNDLDGFDKTTAEIKQTIGDLSCAQQAINKYIKEMIWPLIQEAINPIAAQSNAKLHAY